MKTERVSSCLCSILAMSAFPRLLLYATNGYHPLWLIAVELALIAAIVASCVFAFIGKKGHFMLLFLVGAFLASGGAIVQGRVLQIPVLYGLPLSFGVPGDRGMLDLGVSISLHFLIPFVVVAFRAMRESDR